MSGRGRGQGSGRRVVPEPLAGALHNCRRHLLIAAGFSALVNILYLAPTLYMLQIYDRVLPTGGLLSLAFLTLAVVFALATLAMLDSLRQHARQLEIDWAQLQLDQSTLGKNERIEQIARTSLNMSPLTPARTQYLTEGAK